MDKLLPCPFCGGEAEILKENHGFGNPFVYRSGCRTIDCRGLVTLALGQHSEKKSIELWNTRYAN